MFNIQNVNVVQSAEALGSSGKKGTRLIKKRNQIEQPL
jgi:hypothetical protein